MDLFQNELNNLRQKKKSEMKPPPLKMFWNPNLFILLKKHGQHFFRNVSVWMNFVHIEKGFESWVFFFIGFFKVCFSYCIEVHEMQFSLKSIEVVVCQANQKLWALRSKSRRNCKCTSRAQRSEPEIERFSQLVKWLKRPAPLVRIFSLTGTYIGVRIWSYISESWSIGSDMAGMGSVGWSFWCWRIPSQQRWISAWEQLWRWWGSNRQNQSKQERLERTKWKKQKQYLAKIYFELKHKLKLLHYLTKHFMVSFSKQMRIV